MSSGRKPESKKAAETEKLERPEAHDDLATPKRTVQPGKRVGTMKLPFSLLGEGSIEGFHDQAKVITDIDGAVVYTQLIDKSGRKSAAPVEGHRIIKGGRIGDVDEDHVGPKSVQQITGLRITTEAGQRVTIVKPADSTVVQLALRPSGSPQTDTPGGSGARRTRERAAAKRRLAAHEARQESASTATGHAAERDTARIAEPLDLRSGLAQVPLLQHRQPLTRAAAAEALVLEDEREAVTAGPAVTARWLQDTLGQQLTAYLAGIKDAKMVGRWASGRVQPREDAQRRMQLAYTAGRLLTREFGPATTRSWFFGTNSSLGGSAPAQVLRHGGSPDDWNPVVAAAKQFAYGG